jgi:toxin ParE1/3/4
MAAERFVKNLRKAVSRLRRFPRSGWIVEEWQDPNIREILFGNYRIVHRVLDNVVEILVIRHGSRLLHDEFLKDQ